MRSVFNILKNFIEIFNFHTTRPSIFSDDYVLSCKDHRNNVKGTI